MSDCATGVLYVVATPIGNLDDMSERGRRALANSDAIAAEDTRRTARLLSHFGVKADVFAFHEHNEAERVRGLIERLKAGESIALVCDAGTPLLSDPGYRLLAAAAAEGITRVSVPGPSAITAALSVAGLATDRFTFEGFLPPRRSARQRSLQDLAGEQRTMVFFEAVHRIEESLADMRDIFGDSRKACVARELTKRHEQVVNGTLAELCARIGSGDITRKGEFVVIVAGNDEPPGSTFEHDKLLQELLLELPVSKAVAVAVRLGAGERNTLYKEALALQRGEAD